MTTEADFAIERRIKQLETVVKRRQLFRAKLDKEVMDELADFLGVNDAVFAFRALGDKPIDPYLAAQRDALMGVVRGLQYEIDHLEQAEDELSSLKKQLEDD